MIQVSDIVKRYDKLEVLRGISLTVNKGEVMAIVGPSGAGKTTLLQIMGTLESADSGSVTYQGLDVTSLSDRKLSKFRNSNIGFVFQFHQLLPEFSLLENVALPAIIAGEPRTTSFDKARRLMDYMGVLSRSDHRT
ncbi:MAG: ATP-binding cassette domain-containing protein, partial [Muribaculaceae bacterium]|nr:ATP-binding cassette domain-containing protein [Muribaculaceae bacterium]